MSEQLDLGQFLDQHRADGVQESEGGFTVSHQNAAKKLARFALPRPYAWVSKFVQAAVSWKCREVRIQQTRKTTQFQYLTDHLSSLPTEEELVSVMLSGKVGGELPIENFCVGLRSLVEQAHLSFLLVVDDGEVKPKPVYAGHFFAQISESERLAGRYRSGPGITLTVAHIPSDETESSLVMANKYRFKISDELDKYCFMSPVPIRLDGRSVCGLLRSSLYCSTDRYRPLLISGAKLPGAPDLPLRSGFETKQLSALTHPLRALRSYGGQDFFSAVILAGLHLPRVITEEWPPIRRFTSVHWVRHGVVVESVRLDVMTHTFGCDLFLNGDGLKTDLTGFQLVESDIKSQRETEVVRALGQVLNRFAFDNRSFLEDRDGQSEADDAYDKKKAAERRIKILLKGSGSGLILTVLNPPLGVPATLAGIVAAYLPKKDKIKQNLLRFRMEFQAMMNTDSKTVVETLQSWTCLPPSGYEMTEEEEPEKVVSTVEKTPEKTQRIDQLFVPRSKPLN